MPTPRPKAGILEIEPYVGGKAESGAGDRTIKLSANESALGASEAAVAAYTRAATTLHRYPDGHATALREAIGRRFNLDHRRIVCGAGSDELIGLLIRAYAGAGDEVLHTEHGFLMYRLGALAAGAHPVAVPETGLRADVDAILKAVTSRTRLVFLANPNNPTGSHLSGAELARLHAGLPGDVVLVIDAAYAEFVDEESYSSGVELAASKPNVVMTRTFSKLFGLAALRVGWMYAAPAIVDVIERIRGPFNVAHPSQVAAVAALEDVEHQERARAHTTHWRGWLAERIGRRGFTVHPSSANFLLIGFPQALCRDAAAAGAFFEEHGVLTRAMGAYGLPDCLRVTVGREDENRRVMVLLEEFAR